MSVYRRLVRAKKGMSTIFGALFFIILILMGFNLMLWNFIQVDSYNSVNSSMTQRDQLALSENLIPINPGLIGSGSNSFNITANNVGGVAVSIARIYITNVYNANSTVCSTGPCIAEPAPSTTPYTIVSPNIQAGCAAQGSPNCLIKVTGPGLDTILCDPAKVVCSIFKVILATTRGRLFSLLYPWPAPPPITVNSGLFQTNIGPITVFFDFKSFNFTMASQTTSQGAWVMPTNTPVVIWIKVQNAASDSDIKLRVWSTVLFQAYGAGGVGSSTPFYVVAPSGTVNGRTYSNPNSLIAYNDNTNPYILQRGSVNGPGPSQTIFFGARTLGSTSTQNFQSQEQTWIVYIGFYYQYKGTSCSPSSPGYDPTYGCLQGQTVPFVAARTCTLYPAASCY